MNPQLSNKPFWDIFKRASLRLTVYVCMYMYRQYMYVCACLCVCVCVLSYMYMYVKGTHNSAQACAGANFYLQRYLQRWMVVSCFGLLAG